MANAFLCPRQSLTSVPVLSSREFNLTQQWHTVATAPGISSQGFRCYRNQALCNNSVCSLQVSRDVLEDSQRHGWRMMPCKGGWPSTSCIRKLQGLSYEGHRNKRLFRRPSKDDDDSVLDWQRAPASVINTQSEGEIEGSSNVEIGENEKDESAQAREDHFNRFAIAMAVNDNEMAQQVMREIGNPAKVSEMKQLVDHMTELEEQLQELYEEVNRMIAEGEEETARDVIQANYYALSEQMESGVQGIEQAAMLDVLAQLHMSLGDFEDVNLLLEQTKEVLDNVGTGRSQPLMDNILEHMGSLYTALGKPKEALPFYLRSLEIQEDLLGKDSPFIVKVLLGLANTYSEMDKGSKAIEVYERVLAIIEGAKGPNDKTLTVPLSHLGHSLLEEGRVDEAELSMLRALRLEEKAWGPHDGRVGVATCAVARIKVAKGEVDHAVFLYRKGLQIMKGCSKFSEDDPTIETVRTDLAELLNILERNEEALELWEENLQVKEKVVGSNDPQLVVHLQNLATSYAASEKYDKCEPLLRRSLKLVTTNLGPNSPQVSVPLECLATALHHMDQQDEAETLARQALQIREAAYGSHSAIVGEACNCLASILHSMGRNEEALTLMWRVLAIQERELGPDGPEIGYTLELLVMLLHSLGRTAEIPPLIERGEKLNIKLGGENPSP